MWTRLSTDVARTKPAEGFRVFMGGDHALSLGTVSGVSAHAAATGRPLFALWLDGHPDIKTPASTVSGNLHGTPFGCVTGEPGFDGLPAPTAPVPFKNICFIALRSLDLPQCNIRTETGVTAIAPAVGTTVPGATFGNSHPVMEMLHDSGLVTSLDLVELDPFFDERGRTAPLMVDLSASLFGRRVFDRPTHSHS